MKRTNRQVSDLVAGMGLATEIVSRVVKAAEKAGIPAGDIYALAGEGPGAEDAIRAMVDAFIAHCQPFSLVNDEVEIAIPACRRPTLVTLRARFPWIDKVERDTSPEEAVVMRLATVLSGEEKDVDGDVFERRLAPRLKICLGFQQAIWLVEHQDEYPALKALIGKIYADFVGLVVMNEHGLRLIPCFDDDGKRFTLSWRILAHGFRDHSRIAVSGK